jgi:microcystin degradation protein MlrC
MTKKILIGELKHETNSFIPQKTDRRAYENFHLKLGDEVIPYFEGVETELKGMMTAFSEDGIDFLPVIGAEAMPGGPVTREFFDFALNVVLEALRNDGPFDGVLLALHGAMVLEDSFDAEGELLSAIRGVVGPDMPVMITLDLHANVTAEMQRCSTVTVGYDTYPHIDMYLRGYEAAKIMARTLRGEIRPVMRYRRIPLLSPTIPTSKQPYAGIMKRVEEMERIPGVVSVSVMHGFAWSDIPEVGVSVVAVTDGDELFAESLVDELAERIWSERTLFVKNLLPPGDAVRRALESPLRPVLLADTSDNPGGGAPTDGTQLLAELLRQKARDTAFALIVDPESVEAAIRAGVGERVHLRLGGKTAPKEHHGAPLEIEGKVLTIADGRYTIRGPMCTGLRIEMGRTAVVDVDGIEVVITELRTQPWDAEVFRRLGIEPSNRKVLVVKSAAHFRASFEPIAKEIFEVDLPGLVSNNFANFQFHNILRPVFPLDGQD